MAKRQGKVGENKSKVVRDLPLVCGNETAAVEFVESLRWNGTPCCPRCGVVDVYTVKDRETGERNEDFRWRCRECSRFFTVRTGTVMEESRIPMRHWCWAFWQMCSSKKGISAKQIQRQTGLSYKSALFLLHRVRFAMADMAGVKLTGTVECDETWVGGKPRYKGPHNVGAGTKKTPVLAMVQRGGNVRVNVVPNVTAATLRQHMQEHIDPTATIMTDEHSGYFGIGMYFDGGHQTVNHSAKEYARDDVTTNTAEGFFSIVKRGLYGVYHNVSKEHLHRYLAEFGFRWNNRKVDDGERTMNAILGAVGKRLIYREPEQLSA